MSKIIYIAVMMAVANAVAWAVEDTAEIPLLARPVTMDGAFAPDEEWAGALHFTDFTVSSRSDKKVKIREAVSPGIRTEAYLGRTQSDLCIAFRCWHDRILQIKTAVNSHDGPVYSDDSVELFLNAHNSQYNYYHIVANLAGTVYDAFNKESRKGDTSWDSGTVAKGRILEDGYSIEMTIPLSSLNLGLNNSGLVGLNLCRNVSYCVARQTLFGDYHMPGTWRLFRLPTSGPQAFPVAVEKVEWSPFSGEGELTAGFRNLTQRPVSLAGAFSLDQEEKLQKQPIRLDIPQGQTNQLRIPYRAADKGPVNLNIILKNEKGETVLTVCRNFTPRPLAIVSVDSDVIFRGDCPCVTIDLGLSRAALAEHIIRLVARAPGGAEIYRREIKPGDKTRLEEEVDLSAAPPGIERLELEAVVMNTANGKAIISTTIPMRFVQSPWEKPGQ